MENHSDSGSTQILGDWDSHPPAPAHARVEGTRKGRVLPPSAHPSYEWGGGKWKEDGRKNRKKKESDLSSLSLEEDLMNKYSSLPPTGLDGDQPEQQEPPTGLEQTNKDKVVVIDDADDEVQTRVIVIDGNDTSAEQQPVDNNCDNTSRETSSPSSGARVKCTKDGAWLICGSDDESGTDLVKNIPPRPESDLCWKCQRQGGDSLLLLTCSRSECGTKVHKECLNGEVQFDEHGNFLCPVCWFDRMATEYHECQELLRCAKRKLVKFLPLLSRASKRLIDDDGRSC